MDKVRVYEEGDLLKKMNTSFLAGVACGVAITLAVYVLVRYLGFFV
jgi:hypothetical protein